MLRGARSGLGRGDDLGFWFDGFLPTGERIAGDESERLQESLTSAISRTIEKHGLYIDRQEIAGHGRLLASLSKR